MFSKPEHGWTYFSIQDENNSFTAPASYITDIINDCINAFIYALETNRSVVIDFDAKGWEYKLVCSEYESFIIVKLDGYSLEYFDVSIEDLITEFISDIDRNYESWTWWNGIDKPCDNFSENLNRLKELMKG